MKWHNESGAPLSSIQWLKAHHQAKLAERKLFAYKIRDKNPTCIVDLGCGPGLWLDVLNKIMPKKCKFIGIDNDDIALDYAKTISKDWSREVEFISCDILNSNLEIPKADVYLAFNIFPYVKKPEQLLQKIYSSKNHGGTVIVRQYDGATLRFGPMKNDLRIQMDKSLYASVGISQQFHHYDLDRVHLLLSNSPFKKKHIEFELFQRNSPFSLEFTEYFDNTIEWTGFYLNESSAKNLSHWYIETKYSSNKIGCYFIEADLIAELS